MALSRLAALCTAIPTPRPTQKPEHIAHPNRPRQSLLNHSKSGERTTMSVTPTAPSRTRKLTSALSQADGCSCTEKLTSMSWMPPACGPMVLLFTVMKNTTVSPRVKGVLAAAPTPFMNRPETWYC